ncbi:acyltransferase [Candidatus Sumerlaeota bacterium]|nr:acyltransferase [Candidatus Sumerlaeota bacterium]
MTNIPALTALRFLAALAVFLHHWLSLDGHLFWGDDFILVVHENPILRLMWEGRFGVTLFFALSGFLLTVCHYGDFNKKSGWGRFFLKRAARILPLYFFLLALLFLLHIAMQRHYHLPMDRYFVYATLTQAFFADLKFNGMETAWSLTVEWCFYLTLPMMILMLRRIWRDDAGLARNLSLSTVALFLIGLILLLIGTMLRRQEVFTLWGFMETVQDWRSYTYFGRFYDFAFGMIAGMIYIKSGNRWLRRPPLADAAVAASSAGILILCYLSYGLGGIETYHGWLLNLPGALLSAVFIYFLCCREGRISRVLSWKPFVYLGQISFALYLIHKWDFTNWIYKKLAATDIPAIVSILALYVFFSLVSAALYELIERPGQWWVLRMAGGRRNARPPWAIRRFREWRGLPAPAEAEAPLG